MRLPCSFGVETTFSGKGESMRALLVLLTVVIALALGGCVRQVPPTPDKPAPLLTSPHGPRYHTRPPTATKPPTANNGLVSATGDTVNTPTPTPTAEKPAE